MKKTCLSILLLLIAYTSSAQKGSHFSPDLDIETNTGNTEFSTEWFKATRTYLIAKDSVEKHGGNYSISITSQAGDDRKAGVAMLSFPAEYAGKTIELRGYLKLKNVTNGFAGLFMRIDGESGVLSYDVNPTFTKSFIQE